MRIAVFTNGFDSGGSGIVQSLLAGARALARRGHVLLLGLPRGEGVEGPERAAVDERLEVIRLASLPLAAGSGGPLVFPTGVAALHCRAWAPDLVHAHGPFGAGLEAMAAARLGDVPLIGTSHGSIGELMWRGPAALAALGPGGSPVRAMVLQSVRALYVAVRRPRRGHAAGGSPGSHAHHGASGATRSATPSGELL